MRIIMKIFFLLLCGVITTSYAKSSPNVVLIVADDLGYHDLGCYGAKDISTPHLDKLAKTGLRLTQYYAGSSVCSASRASLLTGCYPPRIGIMHVIGSNGKYGIHTKELTLAESFKHKGYKTGLFGKWHLGNQMMFRPSRHGFDENYGTIGSNDMGRGRPSQEARRLGKAGVEVIDGDHVVETNPDQRFLTRESTDRVIDFIQRHKDKPFFVYIPYNMPHTPLFVSPKFEGSSKRGLFGDVIQEMDHEVGRILKELEQQNLTEDTIVIFTSDNGPWLIYGNHGGQSTPWLGGKKQLKEGGVRVPCLLRYPKKWAQGQVLNDLCSAVDIYPTLVSTCNTKIPELVIDGLDFEPYFKDPLSNQSPREYLSYYYKNELVAVRNKKFKLVFPHIDHDTPDIIGMDGLRGTVAKIKREQALYDISHAPGENINRENEFPEIVDSLQQYAKSQRIKLGDSLNKIKGKECRKAGQSK
jgi:arylsulfatase